MGVSWLKIAEHTVGIRQLYPKQRPQSRRKQHNFSDEGRPADQRRRIDSSARAGSHADRTDLTRVRSAADESSLKATSRVSAARNVGDSR